MIYECKVTDMVPLRMPKVYRVKTVCEDKELEIELHEEIVEAPKIGMKITVTITNNKEECLSNYFCAYGYVVSNTQIGDVYRVVISLHGFLIVVKSKTPLEHKELEHLYVGVTYT
ncbi:MAG: DNA-directed RNA polymerase subunit G [Desulfurococcaceae archaeon]|jgi:DNA-directed RNA polymerase subunit G|nr:DNA-directed RNA polymerase subunit G [Desulfurococcaceae archaeon]